MSILKITLGTIASVLLTLVFLSVLTTIMYFVSQSILLANFFVAILLFPIVLLGLFLLGLILLFFKKISVFAKRLPFFLMLSSMIAVPILMQSDLIGLGLYIVPEIIVAVLLFFNPVQEKIFKYKKEYTTQTRLQNNFAKIVIILILPAFSMFTLSQSQIIDRAYRSSDISLFDSRECKKIPKNVYRRKKVGSYDPWGGGSSQYTTYLRDECYQELAKETKNLDLCDNIREKNEKSEKRIISQSACRRNALR